MTPILQQKMTSIREIGTTTLKPYNGENGLEQLVKAGAYKGYVNSDITSNLFTAGVIGSLDEEVEYVFVESNKAPSSEEMLAWAKANNCERPTAGDALRFWIQLPEKERRRPLFFLHEPVFRWAGCYGVALCLRNGSISWLLGLCWFDSEWSKDDVFVFVRKRKKTLLNESGVLKTKGAKKIWCVGPKPEFELDDDVWDQWYISARMLTFVGPDDIVILPGGNERLKEFVEFLWQTLGRKPEQVLWTSGKDYLLDEGIRKELLPELRKLLASGEEWVLVPYSITEPFLTWATQLNVEFGVNIVGDDLSWTNIWANKGVLHPHITPNRRQSAMPVLSEIAEGVSIPLGYTCETKDDLIQAAEEMSHSVARRMILKPVNATTGEGIIANITRHQLENYAFPMGDVILEEMLEIDSRDGTAITLAVHFVGQEILGVSEQLLKGSAYAGNSFPARVSSECEAEALRMTRKLLEIIEPHGPGGFDFLVVDGRPVFVDPNVGRFNGGHPMYNFTSTYAPGAKAFQGFKVQAKRNINEFWQKLQQEGLAFNFGGEAKRGIFPLCWLPEMWAMLVVVGDSPEELEELKGRAMLCL